MYPVSEQFLQTIRQPVIDYYVDGTIGSVEFDESNIVTGSFHIQNQCTDTSDVILGSVYTGSLTATFYGLNIPRYSWVGKVITPMFYLHVGNSWQSVPLGVYTIKEAKHSAEGVEITAYDNMIKLDKKFKASKFKTAQKMYQHLTTICTTCGLILGMTEQEIQALPNGNTNLGIVGTKSNKYLNHKKYSNDIDTYRDLVFWIAQSMGTFATINRSGELVFRKYKRTSTAVDEITESYRLAGAVFDDFTTNYTGIYVTNTKDGDEVYYGYDVTELQTEINEVSAEMTQIASQQETLWQEYQQGQITEEEYKAAMKPLNKSLKNLQKRMNWLTQALEKAQDEEDGLFMDLGENPILQPDGIGSTYAAMRQRVLKALDAISYTPFSCSTVVGVHYDLGDVIQFTGGHATEVGEACCMMAYDFNLNGEFQMQGFGSDPSKPVIKNKNSKKADKADKNGVSAPTVNTGTSTLEAAEEGDLFVTAGGAYLEALDLDNVTASSTSAHPISITDQSIEDGAYTIEIKGIPSSWGDGEELHIPLDGLTVGNSYKIEFDGQFTQAQSFTEAGTDYVTVSGTRINLTSDTNQHHYSAIFTYVDNGEFYFTPYKVKDNYWFTYVFSNLVISNNDGGGKIEVYENNQWRNVKFVRKIFDTLSGGKKIGTVDNSDDTTTDIYVPNMSGASASAAGSNGLVPAPASGDEGKFLRGDGTWQNAGGGGGSDLELEIDNGEIVATYGAQTEETEPILKDSTGDDIVTMLEAIATEMGALASPEIYAPIVYSTEEREIGVAENGKPLYQKTIRSESIAADSISSAILSNVDTYHVISLKTIKNDETTNEVPFCISTYNVAGAGTLYAYIRFNASTHEMFFINQSRTQAAKVEAVIQYTKTTDIAGSGSYAALGVPAVHYSTSEQVIGTWIDGKPIYEKTVDCGALLNNATKTVAHGIANISKVVEYKGISFDTNGYSICLPYAGFGDWSVSIYANATNIYLQTKQNRTDCVNSYVTLRYTKTTD